MPEQQKQKQPKPYSRPEIIYEREIEVLATVCDTDWTGTGCMTGGCDKRST